MPLRITLELSDDDLRRFRRAMRSMRAAVRGESPRAIAAAARTRLAAVDSPAGTSFVGERLEALVGLIEMLEDPDWQMPREERERVLAALAYFAEERDLVPDTVPGLGFLDDAVMIELVLRDLRHEIESYVDFCRYRSGPDAGATLDARRRALQSRSRRRRRRRSGPRLF